MSIITKLENFVSKVFKTTLEIFLEALKLSPNAQGYVSGSITELLLKKHLESLGYTIERIREKWAGRKHPNHHGDFYFKDKNGNWFVLESKGVKSNSEKWHKLYNYDKLKKFLFSHHEKINWIDKNKEIELQIDNWIKNNLPEFLKKYSETLYDYEEIIKYKSPKRDTPKSKAIANLRKYSREQIDNMINTRLKYLMHKIKVLETHFVSGAGGLSGRTQATPRKNEFNIISIDIFLRFTKHKFLFANPQNLESSGADVNHLQQNYIMGFVFNEDELCLSDEWHNDFNEVLDTIGFSDAIREEDMQVDNRNVVYEDED
ncbi:hypothetical protein QUF75_11450 [Desulfococcaceae bacterium HSG7]|nr:hypothetical protein [Desulfococcaceae bacterium HSG7]